MLHAQLPSLEEKCPEVAKQIKDALPTVPAQAPAALLHGAQTACQVAFKELQHAESDASQLELEINDTLAEVREKVQALNVLQNDLVQLRAKYDIAAKAAQIEVQRTRTNGHVESEIDHVFKLVQQYTPDQLEVMAASLSKAAREVRASKSNGATPTSSPKSSPKLQPAQHVPGADMSDDDNIFPEDAASQKKTVLEASSEKNSALETAAPHAPLAPGADAPGADAAGLLAPTAGL